MQTPVHVTVVGVAPATLQATLEGDGRWLCVHTDTDWQQAEHVEEREGTAQVLLYCPPEGEADCSVVAKARIKDPTLFIVVVSPSCASSASVRWTLCQAGTNMVTAGGDVAVVLERVAAVQRTGNYQCPYCPVNKLTEDSLWHHLPLYHINAPNITATCPVCGLHSSHPIQVHVHNAHGPVARGEVPPDSPPGPPLYAFALVVCRHPDGRFLLVQEHGAVGYWLPGGRVDPSEGLTKAAVRETKEEAGIDVKLSGILRIEYKPRHGYVRLRVIFSAAPADPTQLPKSLPDYESVGAVWVEPREVGQLTLRGSEPAEWIPYMEGGGVVHPLDLLAC